MRPGSAAALTVLGVCGFLLLYEYVTPGLLKVWLWSFVGFSGLYLVCAAMDWWKGNGH